MNWELAENFGEDTIVVAVKSARLRWVVYVASNARNRSGLTWPEPQME